MTTSGDQTVRLFNATTGARLGEVKVDSAFPFAGFREDGEVLITSLDGRLFRWNSSTDAAVEFACRAAGRDLSREEWRQSSGNRRYVESCRSG